MSGEPLKVYLQEGRPLRHTESPNFPFQFKRLFEEMKPGGYVPAKAIQEADVVVFTGGEDVSPILYGEGSHSRTQFKKERDINDLVAYHFSGKAQLRLGICRGAQFLNVMSGGKLWQHHDGAKGYERGHLGNHKIFRNVYSDINNPEETPSETKEYLVTSTHHQIMRPGPKAVVLGHAICPNYSFSLCSRRHTGSGLTAGSHRPFTQIIPEEGAWDDDTLDPEIVWYPETQSLCVQGHPEYGIASDEFVEDVQQIIEKEIGLCAA